jgi:hypothetical protein
MDPNVPDTASAAYPLKNLKCLELCPFWFLEQRPAVRVATIAVRGERGPDRMLRRHVESRHSPGNRHAIAGKTNSIGAVLKPTRKVAFTPFAPSASFGSISQDGRLQGVTALPCAVEAI